MENLIIEKLQSETKFKITNFIFTNYEHSDDKCNCYSAVEKTWMWIKKY